MKLELVDEDIAALKARISNYATAVEAYHSNRLYAVLKKLDTGIRADDHDDVYRRGRIDIKAILANFDKENKEPEPPDILP